MGADRYDIVSTLPPGESGRTRLAWQIGAGGFRRAVVLRQLPEGGEAHPAAPGPNNVLPLMDVTQAEGSSWAVYEFVAGATFAEVSAAHFSVERLASLGLIARVVVDACRAIHQVHAFVDPLGLLPPQKHGGLSAASLFIGFDGLTRVLDLGARRSSRFTAPEALKGDAFDARADVFSLGAVLHHVTTRFEKPYAATMARAPSPSEFPPPSSVHPEATFALDAVVMRALMPSPGSRFSSALQLAEEIEQVLGKVIFNAEQVHTVLLPLFAERISALKYLVDPKRVPLPRPSAPRKPRASEPAPPPVPDVQLDGNPFQSDIEDLPTQHNIQLPADFDPNQTNPVIKAPAPVEEPDFDPNATTPGRTLASVIAQGGAARASGRQQQLIAEHEKERAKGQEKISTADLEPDELSPQMKALQAPDLNNLGDLLDEPTNIKPRLSQPALPAAQAYEDPKKKIETVDIDRSEAPSEVVQAYRSRRGPKVVIALLTLLVVSLAGLNALRPDLIARLKGEGGPADPPAFQEVVLEDIDAGIEVVPAPAANVATVGAEATDAGDDDDEEEAPAVVPDSGAHDAGAKAKHVVVKKKKKKRRIR